MEKFKVIRSKIKEINRKNIEKEGYIKDVDLELLHSAEKKEEKIIEIKDTFGLKLDPKKSSIKKLEGDVKNQEKLDGISQKRQESLEKLENKQKVERSKKLREINWERNKFIGGQKCKESGGKLSGTDQIKEVTRQAKSKLRGLDQVEGTNREIADQKKLEKTSQKGNKFLENIEKKQIAEKSKRIKELNKEENIIIKDQRDDENNERLNKLKEITQKEERFIKELKRKDGGGSSDELQNQLEKATLKESKFIKDLTQKDNLDELQKELEKATWKESKFIKDLKQKDNSDELQKELEKVTWKESKFVKDLKQKDNSDELQKELERITWEESKFIKDLKQKEKYENSQELPSKFKELSRKEGEFIDELKYKEISEDQNKFKEIGQKGEDITKNPHSTPRETIMNFYKEHGGQGICASDFAKNTEYSRSVISKELFKLEEENLLKKEIIKNKTFYFELYTSFPEYKSAIKEFKNSIEQKTLIQNEKLLLIRPDFQVLLKKFHEETGDWANFGTKFHPYFKNWIENNSNIKNDEKIIYLKKIDGFNKNNIIKYIIIDEIINTNNTQREIANNIMENYKIEVSNKTIGYIAKEVLSKKQYDERFHPHNKVDSEIHAIIIKLIRKSNKTQREIADYISKKYNAKIWSATVQNIARKELTKKLYRERFPEYPWKLDDKVRNFIIKRITATKKTQIAIVADIKSRFGKKISPQVIAYIAKEVLPEKQYRERFPSYKKINEETLNVVEEQIKTTKNTIQEIADEFGISPSSVSRIAKKFFKTKKEYKIRFPQEERPRLGQLFHNIATKALSDWGVKRGIKVQSEHDIIKKFPRFREIRVRPDNLIIVNDKFRKLSHIPLNIKYIVLDYSLDSGPKKFIEKSEKGYQAKDTLFIFVPFAFDKIKYQKIKYQIPNNISYKENVWILFPQKFFSFFNFTEDEKNIFMGRVWNMYYKLKNQKKL